MSKVQRRTDASPRAISLFNLCKGLRLQGGLAGMPIRAVLAVFG